jgi:hypothetical protein
MAVIDKVIENAQEWVERKRKYMLENLADIKNTIAKIEESLDNNDNFLEAQLWKLQCFHDNFKEYATEYKSCKAMVRMLEYNKQEDEKKEKEAVTN